MHGSALAGKLGGKGSHGSRKFRARHGGRSDERGGGRRSSGGLECPGGSHFCPGTGAGRSARAGLVSHVWFPAGAYIRGAGAVCPGLNTGTPGARAPSGSPSAIVRAMLERPLPRWLAWAMDPEQARRAPFLAHSPLFAGLPRRLLGRLATRFLEKAYSRGGGRLPRGRPRAGALRRRRGHGGDHPGDAAGRARRAHAGRRATPSASSPSSTSSRRSGSARVAEPARLLILYKTDFDALMDGEARIAVVVMRNLSRVLAAYTRGATRWSRPSPRPGRRAPSAA